MDPTGGLSRARTRPWLALVAVCFGGMMVALDGTGVTIAAPLIARSIHASLGDLELIANVYLVVLALGILPAGALADRIGRRVTFVVGAGGFGLCSLAISLSHAVGALVAFRAAQGLFGALLQPAALALLSSTFPRDRLGVVLGIWGAVNGLAVGLGPLIAGLVVQAFGWPAVFLINVPIAALAVGLILVSVGESRSPPAPGPVRAVLGARPVRWAAVLVATSSFAVFGVLFLLTLYLQNVHGLSAGTAGEWLLTPTLAVVLGAPVGGIMAERIGPVWPVITGMIAVAAGLVGLSGISASATFSQVAWPAVLIGFGVGVWVIAAMQTIVVESPPELVGTASAVQQASSQVGGVLGVLVFGGVMAQRVSAGLAGRLRGAGLPGPVVSHVLGSRGLVGEGRVPLPRGASPQVAAAVRAATHLSFLDGMHKAFLLSAAVIVLAVPLARLLGSPRPQAG
ncbi:MAG TPA: MFS transporter [Solirubrobacteraceae bacterium]|nr:MFS transporter [Solirubrobacteraceae bacterium]